MPILLFAVFGGLLGLAVFNRVQEVETEKKQAEEARRRAEAERARAEAERRAEDEQVQNLVMAAFYRIARAFGVPAPALVFTEQVRNAGSDGARILVNPQWFRVLLGTVCEDPTCDSAVAHGIMGHEMGHHVHGDALVPMWIRQHHCQELRADFYAGRVLRLFNEDFSAIERVLRAIAPTETPTHPAFPYRIRAAREGYQHQRMLEAEA